MKSIEKKLEVFERMPVRRAVLNQILPAVAGQMIVLIYNLADTYFVGLLNSPVQTAAITVAYPPVLTLSAIASLFGVGGASALSRSMGKRDFSAAGTISSISFWLGGATALLFCLLFWLFRVPILTFCGADGELLTATAGYCRWVIFIGGTATVLNLILSHLVRAEGNSAMAFWGVAVGALVNIVLDPFFVLPQYLNMGAEGAGFATAISNVCGMVFLLCYCVVKRFGSIVSISVSGLRKTRAYMAEILSVGMPSFLQGLLLVVSITAMTMFVTKYPVEAVAGYGIVKKLDNLPLYFALGTSSGLLPILSFNYSAGNAQRQKACFLFGSFVAVTFAVLCIIVYELFPYQLAGLLMKDTVTLTYAAKFMRMMVLCMPFVAINHTLIIQFQAMKRVKESLICSVLRKGALDIPLLFLMDSVWPLYGCMLVQPIVDLIAFLVALALYFRMQKQLSRS